MVSQEMPVKTKNIIIVLSLKKKLRSENIKISIIIVHYIVKLNLHKHTTITSMVSQVKLGGKMFTTVVLFSKSAIKITGLHCESDHSWSPGALHWNIVKYPTVKLISNLLQGQWCWKYVYVLLTVKDRKEEKSVPSSYLESLANTLSKMTTN